MRTASRWARYSGLIGLSVTGLLVSGCAGDYGMFGAAGPIAEAQRSHFLLIVGWMLVVSLPLFVALPFILWRYRLGNRKADYRPDWKFSPLLEALIWGVPILVVAVLGYEAWRQSYQLDPYRPITAAAAPLDIQVIGMDWKWLFIYPDARVASVNEVLLPVDRPVRFRLTSASVLQSFMIPRLGGQMYAMPGMVSEINLIATRAGEYRGLNTQFNGEGFARQKFVARAVSDRQFRRWLNNTAQTAPPLDAAALARLRKPSLLPSPVRFGSFRGDPFRSIVAQIAHAGDGAGPAHTQGGH